MGINGYHANGHVSEGEQLSFDFHEAKSAWEIAAAAAKTTGFKHTSLSGEEVEQMYTPDDVKGWKYMEKLGFPGEYPFTRGVHANMYRGKVWTMRQFAGFGTPEDTNERFKYLLAHGQTGLSTAFDLPTLMGRDSDDPMSEGEVGICGVAVSSLADMELLFDGIPVDKVSTSMTINSPAIMVFAYYLVVAEKQGIPFSKLRGKLQNDILKEDAPPAVAATARPVLPPITTGKKALSMVAAAKVFFANCRTGGRAWSLSIAMRLKSSLAKMCKWTRALSMKHRSPSLNVSPIIQTKHRSFLKVSGPSKLALRSYGNGATSSVRV